MIPKSVRLCFAGTVWLLLSISLQTQQTESANILALYTCDAQSHLIVHMSSAKALAERGHNVTVVTIIQPKVMDDRINHILIPMTEEQEREHERMTDQMATKKHNLLSMLMDLLKRGHLFLDKQYSPMNDSRFRDLYENPDNKFDLVILGFFFNNFQLGVAAKLKCPVVLDWTAMPMEMVNSMIGNPREISYAPEMNIGVRSGEIMAFPKRFKNFLSSVYFRVVQEYIHYFMERSYKKLFPDDDFPTYKEMHKNVSLLFCNSASISEGPIRPNVPALIEIGGIQIKDKPDPLPKEIANFLNASSSNGAILFSLGSILKGSTVKPETVKIFFKVLSGLKQNVIWKWENLESTPGKSPNILYQKWVPQDDILAHPNVKLFITHAGKGGIAESQFHGVPMVALPMFGDQPGNANKMATAGYGLELNLLSLKENEFRNAILEVLNNPSYANKVKRFSELYRDRPLTAKQNLIFWIEYVIRHHGAPHIQSPLIHMNFIQSLNLDVKACIGLALVLAWLIVKFTTRFCYGKISKQFLHTKVNTKLKTQ